MGLLAISACPVNIRDELQRVQDELQLHLDVNGAWSHRGFKANTHSFIAKDSMSQHVVCLVVLQRAHHVLFNALRLTKTYTNNCSTTSSNLPSTPSTSSISTETSMVLLDTPELSRSVAAVLTATAVIPGNYKETSKGKEGEAIDIFIAKLEQSGLLLFLTRVVADKDEDDSVASIVQGEDRSLVLKTHGLTFQLDHDPGHRQKNMLQTLKYTLIIFVANSVSIEVILILWLPYLFQQFRSINKISFQ